MRRLAIVALVVLLAIPLLYAQLTPVPTRCAFLWLSRPSQAGGVLDTTEFVEARDATGLVPNAVETAVDLVVTPLALAFNSLSVGIDVAPGAATSRAVTLRDDGADTAVTCTISGAAATTCLYSGAPVVVAAGSKINWELTNVGDPAEVAIGAMYIMVCASP